MPKKKSKKASTKRRAQAKGNRGARAAIERQQLVSNSKQSVPVSSPSSKVAPPTREAIATRYQYIGPELRRIGIIAGAMFIVIIILAFVLG